MLNNAGRLRTRARSTLLANLIKVALLAIFCSPPLLAGTIEEIVAGNGWQSNRFGPFATVEQACRQEVYSPGWPDDNYAGYALVPSAAWYGCYCYSNPGEPPNCGTVTPNCPPVGGNIVISQRILVNGSLMCRVVRNQYFFLSALPPEGSQCGKICNGVGDPINPADGAVYDTIVDIPATGNAIPFTRFYSSVDKGSGLSTGWRHSFSRNIKPKYTSSHRSFVANQNNSTIYDFESSACTSGFAEIRGRVSTWANATASYANGRCTLRVGTTTIGTVPIYSTYPTPANLRVQTGFDAMRDDGQVVSFLLNGSSLVAPVGIKLRLQQTATGFSLIDENDGEETYDTTGKLLSVTSRAGVIQTMGYDTAGRLSTVTDSFGHGLSLSYDSQGRLSSVTRQ